MSADWISYSLNELGTFRKGKGITKAEVRETGLPCVRYGEIYTHHNTVISSYYSFIDESVARNSLKLSNGDILFAGSGETKEEIGKATAFTFNEEVYAGGDIVIFSPKAVDSVFLAYLLNSKSVIEQKTSLGKGDAVVHISSTDLGKIIVSIPTLISEQKAIAKALSDVDELISETEKLISKKQNFFKGMLENSFSLASGVIPKQIKDLCNVDKGKAIVYDKEFSNGKYGYLNGGIDFSGLTDKFNDDGDTVVVSEGGNSCGYVNYIAKPFWCGGHAYRLLGFNGFQKYLFYAMKAKEFQIMNLRVGSGLPNVQKKNLEEFSINVHLNSQQQNEVTQALDALSDEIIELIKEKAKYQLIKQGMMNDLLTGKVRLI